MTERNDTTKDDISFAPPVATATAKLSASSLRTDIVSTLSSALVKIVTVVFPIKSAEPYQQNETHHGFASLNESTPTISHDFYGEFVDSTLAKSAYLNNTTKSLNNTTNIHNNVLRLPNLLQFSSSLSTTTVYETGLETSSLTSPSTKSINAEAEISALASVSVERLSSVAEFLRQMISYFLNGHMTLCFVISGIFFNTLCIYVFLRFRRSGSPVIQYYLVALTFWQTALLANAFMLYCLPTLLYGHIVSTGSYVYLYPYAYALANTTHTGSVWIILTLTIDRWLALCYPLTHRAIGKKRRVKRLMIVVSVVAIIFSTPRFFEVTTTFYCEVNETSCEPTVARAALTHNRTYWTIYHIILAMLFVTVAPCLLLFALTLRISLALRRAIVKRRQLCIPAENESDSKSGEKDSCVNLNSKKEHKANIMLVLVITKFLISDVLPTVADVLEHLVGNQVFMSSSLATLFVDVSNFLLVLNCSTNFWVFFFWGKRFRRCCLYMITSSIFARAFQKWLRTADWAAEFETTSNQGAGPGLGSSTTNLNISKVSRSRCCSPNPFQYIEDDSKKPFSGFERTIVAESGEGFLDGKLTNRTISRQNHFSSMYCSDHRLHQVPTNRPHRFQHPLVTQNFQKYPPNNFQHHQHRHRRHHSHHHRKVSALRSDYQNGKGLSDSKSILISQENIVSSDENRLPSQDEAAGNRDKLLPAHGT